MSACRLNLICRIASRPASRLAICTSTRHSVSRFVRRYNDLSAPKRFHANQAVAQQSAHSESFVTLAAEHKVTIEVKKSKFVTTAWPISTSDEAQELIEAASDPAASHNCWAYKVGDQFRSTDDGEPGGTAGPPILNAINGEGLDGVCVLVTRIFGGTKLGAGGLIRAYGGAARECLRDAQHCTVTPKRKLHLKLPIGDIGIVYGMLDKAGGERLEQEYSADGQTVLLVVRLEQSQLESWKTAVADASSGRVQMAHDS